MKIVKKVKSIGKHVNRFNKGIQLCMETVIPLRLLKKGLQQLKPCSWCDGIKGYMPVHTIGSQIVGWQSGR